MVQLTADEDSVRKFKNSIGGSPASQMKLLLEANKQIRDDESGELDYYLSE